MLLNYDPLQSNPLLEHTKINNFNNNPLNNLYLNKDIPNNSVKELPSQPHMGDVKMAKEYYADLSGCGFWRMVFAETILNAHQKMIVHGSTVMNYDPRYYVMTKCVRIQRQATPAQLQFVKFLKSIQKQVGFHLVYEIDDVIFSEDIPDYNSYKGAFINPEIRKVSCEIMSMCDEVTVTCQYMKDYYKRKTGNQNITIIPNMPPKFWIGNHSDIKRMSDNYDRFIKKPRVLYAGSAAHFDVNNHNGQKDDFEHVIDVIRKTCDKFQWVFMGGYPLGLSDLVRQNRVEFHQWSQLFHYGDKLKNLNCNIAVAPLQNNIFNKCKSNIKMCEQNAMYTPIVCQDMETYCDAPFKFTTGDEMISQIEDILSKKGRYMNICQKARNDAEKMWLENDENIQLYFELFNYPYADSRRVLLNKLNGIK